MSNFNAYSRYYDLLYKDKAYSAESNYVARTIKRFMPEVKSVLELGSGSGAHAAHLVQEGWNITGIERSETMVEEANKKAIPGFKAIVGDITSTTTEQTFDAAISLFHVISYLTDNAQLLACLRNTHQQLNTGGIFLFDFWYTPAVYTQMPEVRVKRLSNDEIHVTRIAEPVVHFNRNVIDVNFEVLVEDRQDGKLTRLRETHPMRHFSLPELEIAAALTGFELIHSEEFLTAKAPGADTWGVCVVFKKK
jgi:SAM-dependent methyltransferase